MRTRIRDDLDALEQLGSGSRGGLVLLGNPINEGHGGPAIRVVREFALALEKRGVAVKDCGTSG